MRFDESFIEKVVDANNIVEIISQYTDLKARGDQHMGLCPFPDHKEKTPSFSVSESKQLYNCFGCKKAGNIITFLKDYNGFSFVEAIEHLASRAHIDLPKPEETKQNPRGRRTPPDEKKSMLRANRVAAVFYHQNLKKLPDNHKVKAYLKKRNLRDEIVEEFRLGYSPEPWDELTKHLQSKGAPIKITEKLGLIKRNSKGGHFDLFRDRLMFPIFAIDSEVIGFGGRIIDQGQPKYMNSVDSPVFKKGQSFYGLDKAAKFIRMEDRVFVVEGYMDLLALYSNGIKNVVATLGTALTENHVRLLKRWTQNVVLVFDGDQAGQTASERSLVQFFKHDMMPQIFVLPEGMDPDDFVNEKGRERFIEKAKDSEDLFLNRLKTWMKGYRGQPKDKIQLIDQISPLLQALKDNRLKQLYIEEVARRMSEDPRKVYSWLKGAKVAPKREEPAPEPPKKEASKDMVSLDGVAKDELVLLGLSLKSPKYMNFFESHGGLESITPEKLKELFTQVVAKYRQEPSSFDKLAHLVVSQVKNPEKIVSLINISSPNDGSDRDEETFKECFNQVRDRYLQRKAEEMLVELKSDPSDDKLERFVNIQNERKALKELIKSPLGE